MTYFNTNYNLIKGIINDKKTPEEFKDDELKFLKDLGYSDDEVENIRSGLEKLGCEDSAERKKLYEQIKNLINQLLELVGNNKSTLINIINKTVNSAINNNKDLVEAIRNLQIEAAELSGVDNKSDPGSQLLSKLARFLGYETISQKDYEKIKELLEKINIKYNISEHDGKKELQFSYNKPYSFYITSSVETEQPKDVIDNIIKFVSGSLNFMDFVTELNKCGVSTDNWNSAENQNPNWNISKNTKEQYDFTFTHEDNTYHIVLKGADLREKVINSVQDKKDTLNDIKSFSAAELKETGLTDDIIIRFFDVAASKTDKYNKTTNIAYLLKSDANIPGITENSSKEAIMAAIKDIACPITDADVEAALNKLASGNIDEINILKGRNGVEIIKTKTGENEYTVTVKYGNPQTSKECKITISSSTPEALKNYLESSIKVDEKIKAVIQKFVSGSLNFMDFLTELNKCGVSTDNWNSAENQNPNWNISKNTKEQYDFTFTHEGNTYHIVLKGADLREKVINSVQDKKDTLNDIKSYTAAELEAAGIKTKVTLEKYFYVCASVSNGEDSSDLYYVLDTSKLPNELKGQSVDKILPQLEGYKSLEEQFIYDILHDDNDNLKLEDYETAAFPEGKYRDNMENIIKELGLEKFITGKLDGDTKKAEEVINQAIRTAGGSFKKDDSLKTAVEAFLKVVYAEIEKAKTAVPTVSISTEAEAFINSIKDDIVKLLKEKTTQDKQDCNYENGKFNDFIGEYNDFRNEIEEVFKRLKDLVQNKLKEVLNTDSLKTTAGKSFDTLFNEFVEKYIKKYENVKEGVAVKDVVNSFIQDIYNEYSDKIEAASEAEKKATEAKRTEVQTYINKILDESDTEKTQAVKDIFGANDKEGIKTALESLTKDELETKKAELETKIKDIIDSRIDDSVFSNLPTEIHVKAGETKNIKLPDSFGKYMTGHMHYAVDCDNDTVTVSANGKVTIKGGEAGTYQAKIVITDDSGKVLNEKTITVTVLETKIDWNSTKGKYTGQIDDNNKDHDDTYLSTKSFSDMYNQNSVIDLLNVQGMKGCSLTQAKSTSISNLRTFLSSLKSSLSGQGLNTTALDAAAEKIIRLYSAAFDYAKTHEPDTKDENTLSFAFEGEAYEYQHARYYYNSTAVYVGYSKECSASNNQLGLRICNEYDDGEYKILVNSRCIMDLLQRFYEEALG